MRSTCEVEGCGQPVVGQGLCRKHYMRNARKGATDDQRRNARGVCSQEGCLRPHQALGLCRKHYEQHTRSAKRQAAQASAKAARRCRQCGGPIPVERNMRALFCSHECKTRERAASGKSAEASLRHYYRSRYAMSTEGVQVLLDGQGGGCAICGTTDPKGRHSGFHVDHDHATGRVRGVLCHGCNVSLGHFHDNPKLLRKAALYLEQ